MNFAEQSQTIRMLKHALQSKQISLHVREEGGETICWCSRNSPNHGRSWKSCEEDFGSQEFLQRKHNFAVPFYCIQCTADADIPVRRAVGDMLSHRRADENGHRQHKECAQYTSTVCLEVHVILVQGFPQARSGKLYQAPKDGGMCLGRSFNML